MRGTVKDTPLCNHGPALNSFLHLFCAKWTSNLCSQHWQYGRGHRMRIYFFAAFFPAFFLVLFEPLLRGPLELIALITVTRLRRRFRCTSPIGGQRSANVI